MVQYQLTTKYCTLFQRGGRAARGYGRTGKAVLIIEQKYFDDTKRKVQERIAKSLATKEGKRRKAEEKIKNESDSRELKRLRMDSSIDDGEEKPPAVSITTPVIAPAPSVSKGRSSDKQDTSIEDVMDQFINTHLRVSVESLGSDCRRKAGNQFFANPSNPAGTLSVVCISCCCSHSGTVYRR